MIMLFLLPLKIYLHVCCVVEQAEFIVQERLSRLPLKMHAPEKVLCQAHGQARPIADFLHENGDIFIESCDFFNDYCYCSLSCASMPTGVATCAIDLPKTCILLNSVMLDATDFQLLHTIFL